MNQASDKQVTKDNIKLFGIKFWLAVIVGIVAGKFFGLGGVLLVLGFWKLWEYLSRRLKTGSGNE